jgi:8-oxo-dGTP pyrophosphatase MutT (NUDIX family)
VSRGWETRSKTALLKSPFYQIDVLEKRRKGAQEWGSFHVMHPPDWVNIICQTAGGDLVFVRQLRHGIDAQTLEIPGGCIDAGESPLAAAQRELLEETGFTSENWLSLGFVHPNPAMQSNRCYQFLARNAAPTQAPMPGVFEDIECVQLSMEDALSSIDSGEITHALVVSALCAYQRWCVCAQRQREEIKTCP